MKPALLYSAEAAGGWMPWGALAPILCLVLVALPDAAATLILWPLDVLDAHGDPVGAPGFSLFLLVTFTLMGLVFLGWIRFVERRPLRTVGLVGLHRMRTFGVGFAIGLATSAAVVGAIWVAGGFEAGGYLKARSSPTALSSIGVLLVGFALQSSVEELIFRGWLLSGIARKLNLPLAVILSSATFTLLHFEPRHHWPTTATSLLFALFACASAVRSGNILGVMGWHAGWNWLLAVGFEVQVTGLNADVPALLVKLNPIGRVLTTGGAQGPEGSVWCGVVLVASTAIVLCVPRRVVSPLS